MKLHAISDLHVRYQVNRQALEALSSYPEDWLIVAGNLGETISHLHYALTHLTRRFAQIIRVPGNHDLWTLPSRTLEEEINPFPLNEAFVRLKPIPRFSLWCGTRRTPAETSTTHILEGSVWHW